jgi:hypothetical protein
LLPGPGKEPTLAIVDLVPPQKFWDNLSHINKEDHSFYRNGIKSGAEPYWIELREEFALRCKKERKSRLLKSLAQALKDCEGGQEN